MLPFIPRKKLLVILGAGSSISVGLPSVSELDSEMSRWASSWSYPGASDYYGFARCNLEAYQASAPGTVLPPPINFEEILGQMVSLASWVAPAPYGNALREMAGLNLGPLIFGSGFMSFMKKSLVEAQLIHLLASLAGHIRLKSRLLDLTGPAFLKYKELIDALRRKFDVGIYNLNYDTAALSAYPDTFTGFGAKGDFDPRKIHTRRKWGFVYHIHGSVYHSLSGNVSPNIIWKDDLSSTFDDGDPGRSSSAASDNKTYPKTALIAGGHKLDQLLHEPFHTFYASLVRHIWEADAILIGGYGFADIHINRALRSRFDTKTKRPPVMILDYAKGGDGIDLRFDHWTLSLCEFLQADGKHFRVPGHSAPWSIEEIKAGKTFEVASNERVAVWYSGFTEAVDRKRGIIRWLAGAADSVLSP